MREEIETIRSGHPPLKQEFLELILVESYQKKTLDLRMALPDGEVHLLSTTEQRQLS
jgi:hypothetical protein